MKRARLLGTSVGLFFALTSPAVAQTIAAESASDSQETAVMDRVIVTGTRESGRTKFESLAPVDVLSEAAVQGSASAEFGDVLAQLVPSFNVQRLPLAD